MKVAPAVEAEVLGVVSDAAGSTDVTAPRSAEMEPGREMAPVTVQPGTGGARGSVEYLGHWKEEEYRCFSLCLCPSCDKRAMPVKMQGEGEGVRVPTRVAFGRFVDELVQNKAPGGILAIREWTEAQQRGENHWVHVTLWRVSWSTSPDDTSYQRHGSVGTSYQRHEFAPSPEKISFADFEGVIDDVGGGPHPHRMAVYRVTLPREGLNPDKWAGRPPPLAPEDLYTGPRSDGLRSTEDIGGEYCSCCFPFFCSSVTVTPMGADVIEMRKRGWSMFLAFYPCMPICANDILTRERGTNSFSPPRVKDIAGQEHWSSTVFNDDGSMKIGVDSLCFYPFCYRRRSKGRPFRKVETEDVAGTWCHCRMCLGMYALTLCAPYTGAFSRSSCSTKKRLNQDQYEEKGCCCCLPFSLLCSVLLPTAAALLPPALCPVSLLTLLPLPCPFSETRTRMYVNGHPTNGFDGPAPWDKNGGPGTDYRDSGCVDGAIGGYPIMPTISLDCGWKCC